jgi:hypothetical protein
MGEPAKEIFKTLPPGSLAHRGLAFDANPRIKRVVFICTPHRGSKLAISPIAELGMRLITLPSHVAATINNSVSKELSEVGVMSERPNVVTGLASHSPTLKVLDTVPVQAPHHQSSGIAADQNRSLKVAAALWDIGARI